MEKQNTPHIVNLEPGTHYLCRCGKSSKLPLCDGSHKNSEIVPYVANIVETCTLAICACGKSANPFFCDGSHKNITE